MPNGNEPQISPAIWAQRILTPDGREDLLELIREYRRSHGKQWLTEIEHELPLLYWIVDLAANKTADESIKEIADQYPAAWLFGGQIRQLHAVLKQEIDKPR